MKRTKEQKLAYQRAYSKCHYLKNKEKRLKQTKSYYQANKEWYANYRKKWYLENKEEYLLGRKDYYKENKLEFRARDSKRRALEINAMPKWVDTQELEIIYNNCPVGYEVDHIIPLNHKDVCGLHVPWNLQYLTSFENRSKGNRLITSEGIL